MSSSQSTEREFAASAPSNIAVIKYMGKRVGPDGIPAPTNSSLSLTLPGFRTHVRVSELKEQPSGVISWAPFRGAGLKAPELSDAGKAKFVDHTKRSFESLGFKPKTGILIESANDFPSDCGLASSASSFAALTLGVAGFCGQAIEEQGVRLRLAEISRQGSGSSCRSFFEPWCQWSDQGVSAVQGLPDFSSLFHVAIVVDDSKKRVSSSEAHKRVASSLLFQGRPERAEQRLRLVLDCLRRVGGQDGVSAWNRAANLIWAESWDMHALFETSEVPFGYFTAESQRVLSLIRDIASKHAATLADFRIPIVTMDAGPNVHLIFWTEGGGAAQSAAFLDELKTSVRSFARLIEGALG